MAKRSTSKSEKRKPPQQRSAANSPADSRTEAEPGDGAADSPEPEDLLPGVSWGPGNGAADSPEGEEQEDLPGVSWGPGKNIYGWLMSLVLVALVGGVGYAGFRLFGDTVKTAESSGTVEERKKLEREVRTLGADLCTASMQAAGSPDAAAQLFQSKVHGPLHALADALAEEDRPAAAKLLRHKFAVEEDIRRNAPPPEIAASFTALNESTMDGLRILSLPSPACPPSVPPGGDTAGAAPGSAPGAAPGAPPGGSPPGAPAPAQAP